MVDPGGFYAKLLREGVAERLLGWDWEQTWLNARQRRPNGAECWLMRTESAPNGGITYYAPNPPHDSWPGDGFMQLGPLGTRQNGRHALGSEHAQGHSD